MDADRGKSTTYDPTQLIEGPNFQGEIENYESPPKQRKNKR